MPQTERSQTPAVAQRLDKWLWYTRVIKSRTQAAGLVTDGKVRVNRARVDKPGTTVKPGDVVTVTVRGAVRVLKVMAPGVRRGPPAEAQGLYEDVGPSVPAAGHGPGRAEAGGAAGQGAGQGPDQGPYGERAPGSGRPTKRERRQLTRLTGHDE